MDGKFMLGMHFSGLTVPPNGGIVCLDAVVLCWLIREGEARVKPGAMANRRFARRLTLPLADGS
jgi:hypothetical protein